MTSVAILNDTSRFHHGSAAVMQAISELVTSLGWRINASFFGNTFLMENCPPPVDHSVLEQSDILLINGEGTMHDDSRMATFLLNTAETYRHKKTALINTLWQRMSAESEAKLGNFDLVVARDPRSFETLTRLGAENCYLAPDLSMSMVPPTAVPLIRRE